MASSGHETLYPDLKDLSQPHPITKRQENALIFEDGLPEGAPTEIRDAYVQHCIQTWKDQGLQRTPLLNAYSLAFENWHREDFRAISAPNRTELVHFLRTQGVYVPLARGLAHTVALYRTLTEDLEWPENDSDRPQPTPAQKEWMELEAKIQSYSSNNSQASQHASPIPGAFPKQYATHIMKNPEMAQTLTTVPNIPAPQIRSTAHTKPDDVPPKEISDNAVSNQPILMVEPRKGVVPPKATTESETPSSDYYRAAPPKAPGFPSGSPGTHGFNGRDDKPPPQPPPRTPEFPLAPPLRSQAPSDPPDSNFSRNFGNLVKTYTTEDKYTGETDDDFQSKFIIFMDRCDQTGIDSDTDKVKAFSVMLRKTALDYFYRQVKNRATTIQSLQKAMTSRFETEERTRALVRQWDSLSLARIISDNSGKTTTQCLEHLIDRVSKLQHTLPPAYAEDYVVRNKLLNAVRHVPECQLACQKPASTIHGVIADLQAAVANSSEQAFSEAFYTDRHYNGKPAPPATAQHNKSQTQRPGKCFVCGKKGCWSTKHSLQERRDAAKKKPAFKQYFTDAESTVETDEVEEVLQEIEDLTANTFDLEEGEFMLEPHAFTADLCRTAFEHSLSKTSPDAKRKPQKTSDPSLYDDKEFRGIMLDTGAAKGSTVGEEQFQAYCKFIGREDFMDRSRTSNCKFGFALAKGVGIARVEFPVGTLTFSATFHVIDKQTPFLLCINDMDRLGIYLDNLDNAVVHKKSGENMSIYRLGSHPFLLWNPKIHCFFTSMELRRLHRRFGHPHADKLYNLLKRAKPADANEDTRANLERITKHCSQCQIHGQKPRRFKFTLRKEDVDFNHIIYADICHIDDKPVLHVVDEATDYQAARWLTKMTAEAVWQALRICWIDAYLGPPDIIAHDAGKNFVAQAFQDNADTIHVETKGIPVECPQSMAVVERYHTPRDGTGHRLPPAGAETTVRTSRIRVALVPNVSQAPHSYAGNESGLS